ncbi:MAG: glycine cleavage system aminomethyltransferase GcvT [Acidimicrobiia bacterium]|nr:glycine cleavage system aminomethyltransferase GcvT [Acidimicrobiia bacterium]
MPASPIHSIHESLGAKLVEFAGWMMPVHYTGVIEEHEAVRDRCGIFDVSHLGRFRLEGPETISILDRELCNDAAGLSDGRAQYTMALNDVGGVVDDIIVWRRSATAAWVMPNGVNHDRVLARFADAAADVVATDARADTALFAVQGPTAPDVLSAVLNEVPGRFRCIETQAGDADVAAAGTGYTGERGAELIVPTEHAASVWQALVDAGAQPCGLGSRDTLRLEMGYPLWGQDLDESTTPLEAGLEWVVSWDHDFVGKNALVDQREAGPSRRLVGFTTGSRRIARAGSRMRAGSAVGTVTSGNFSPILGQGIGVGYLAGDDSSGALEVEIRGEWHSVERSKPPFVDVG